VESDIGLGQGVLRLGKKGLARISLALDRSLVRLKDLGVGSPGQPDIPGQAVVLLRAPGTLVSLDLPVADLLLEAFDAVAPVTRDRLLHVVPFCALAIPALGERGDATDEAHKFRLQMDEPLLQELSFEACKPWPQSFPAGPLRLYAGRDLGVLVAVGHQRREQFDLLLGLQYGVVCAV
jgi:hypothetical protein